MIKCFLDSNIIANWMLTKLSIKEKKTILPEKDILEELRQKHSRAYSCYLIIEYIRKKKNKNLRFFISDLVLNEVISVIVERYAVEEMLEKGISIKYFQKFREDIDLPEEASRIIHFELFNFKKEYIDKGKIEITNNIKHYSIRRLIGYYKLDTHDSFLINQANLEKCKYFITTDTRLKKLIKKYSGTQIALPETIIIDLKIKL